jgi:hypothetical protein
MRKDFNFRFDELEIDLNLIGSLLGYEGTQLPPPFDEYLEDALKEMASLNDISACFLIPGEVHFDVGGKNLSAGGQDFKPGKTVTAELKGSESLAFFICTAGQTICDIAAEKLKGENPVSGYIYDILGSLIADSAADKMQSVLQREMEASGLKITNRYSPGYCNWSVADQHKLFSLFGNSSCGVSLTESALMYPVKSVSGVIGIGKDVKFREYQCVLCESVKCAYRKLPEKTIG